MEYLVELLCGEEAERDACLLQADVLIERLVCRLGGVLVADIRIERRDEHERAVQVLVHLLAVRLDADGAAVVERLDGVGEQACRLQEVVDNDGHEDVELEIALRGGKADGSIVAHDLYGDHCDGLALGRVDFARHDRAAGLVRGDGDLAESAARSRGEPAHVVCNLHHVGGKSLECAVGKDDGILARERVELVRCSDEGLARQLARRACDGDIKSLRCVESCADGGAAEGELVEEGERCLQLFLRLLKHIKPAADLLHEGDGDGVLQMRASRLDDAVVLCHEATEGCGEEVDRGEQPVLDGDDGGDVHGGREGVVRALRHIRMVVRMEDFLPRDLVAAVRDDLVDVHIGLRAAARLPYGEREVGGELAVEDLITCLADGGEPLLIELAKRVVGDSGRLF